MKRIFINETIKHIDEKVRICGWVDSRRDHGKIIFIDLRDRTGLAQIVFADDLDRKIYKLSETLRPEWVIEVIGTVKQRPEKMRNEKIETGKIEIKAEKLKIYSPAKTLPFPIQTDGYEINEEKRLKYRYLDLRRNRMRKNLMSRCEIIRFIRDYLYEEGFVEIATPLLSKSTPEGARDYLVPSRVHPGKFFALPQSPQQYKQLLMIAGIERYFQIAPCFRDEAARADRSPGEFYQLDAEMSFVTQEDILILFEDLFTSLVKKYSPAIK